MLSTRRRMLIRDFVYPSLAIASLMLSTAFAVGTIWEVIRLLVYI
jgi:hypothetical protein